MTLQETQKIIIMIAALYPTFKPTDKAATLETWTWALQEYSYEDVNRALNIFVKTGNSGFAPSVSQLINLITKVDEMSYPSESEAWAMVRRACKGLDWNNPEREFNKLPAMVKEAVVSVSNLIEWAQLDTGTFESVTSSNFMRAYRAVVERNKELNHMPDEIRERIERARKKMLTEGGLCARNDAVKQLADSAREISEEV